MGVASPCTRHLVTLVGIQERVGLPMAEDRSKRCQGLIIDLVTCTRAVCIPVRVG